MKPLLLAVLLLLVATSACGPEGDRSTCRDWTELSPPDAASAPPEGARKLLAPPDGAYAGFYSIGDVEAGFEAFIDKSDGRVPPIVMTFHDWAGPSGEGLPESNGVPLQDFERPLEGEALSVLVMARRVAERGHAGDVVYVRIDELHEPRPGRRPLAEPPGLLLAGRGLPRLDRQQRLLPDDETLHTADVGSVAYALDDGVAAWRQVTDRPLFVPELGFVARSGEDRSALLERSLLEDIPARDIQAFTVADAPLFEALFSLPRLGHTEAELSAWQAALASGHYAQGPLFRTLGE